MGNFHRVWYQRKKRTAIGLGTTKTTLTIQTFKKTIGSSIRKSALTIQIEFSISHTLNHPKTWGI